MPKLLSTLLAALLLLVAPAAAAARAGDLGAVSILGAGRTNLSGNGVAVQDDGRATVVGSRNGRAFLIARVTRSGRRDRTFGRHGMTTVHFPGASGAEARAVALFRDGRILVGGTVNYGGVRRFAVARLLPGGGLDPNFGRQGMVVVGPQRAQLEAMALEPQGELVLAGSVSAGERRAVLVVRLRADGSLDRSFGAGGSVDSTGVQLAGRARAVALLPDGRIALAVAAERGRRTWATFIAARLTADGAFDPTFGSGGVARVHTTSLRIRDGGAAGLALGSHGRLILGGTARGGGGRDDATVVRVNAAGAPIEVRRLRDPRGRSVRIAAMRRDSRGRLVLAGRMSGKGAAVLRLRGSLQRDRSFAKRGLFAGSLRRTHPAALALAPRTIVLAGSARVDGHGRLVAARLS